MTRLHPTTLLAIFLPAVAGCHSFQTARGPVQEQSLVRVLFETPRVIRFVRPVGDSVALADVDGLEGRALVVRGDTLRLRIQAVRTTRGWVLPYLYRGATTAVVLPAATRVETRQHSSGRTTLTALGAIAGVGLVYLLILFVSLSGNA